jgi:hypothetical protein
MEVKAAVDSKEEEALRLQQEIEDARRQLEVRLKIGSVPVSVKESVQFQFQKFQFRYLFNSSFKICLVIANKFNSIQS